MTTTKNFLGIPIDGTINQGDDRVAQRPLSELEPLLRAVLDDDTIVEFGWTQYTPYFNDGDPCVFSIGEPWFRTDADQDVDDEDLYELEIYGGHSSLGSRPRRWNPNRRDFDLGDYEGPDEARYDRVVALAEAIGSGAFNDVLLDAFGDHAEVRVSRSGIKVNEYSHD